MPEPLPISRDIAAQMRGMWDGETGALEHDIAIIDARVRPLVEAISAALAWDEQFVDFQQDLDGDEWNVYAADLKGWPAVREKLDAALKAAGSE